MRHYRILVSFNFSWSSLTNLKNILFVMLKAKNVRPSVRTLGNKNFTGKVSLPFIENPLGKPSNTAPV